jgi:ABC-type transport system substrate-binding protein
MLAVSDAFTRVGVSGSPLSIPRQGVTQDWEVSFPGYRVANQDHGITGISNLLHSSAAPLPERNYRSSDWPKNRGSYVNPEYDALMDRFTSTIPVQERLGIMGQLVRTQTDLQLVTGFYYTVGAVMMNNRLRNVPPATAWNAHEWDVAG